MKKDFEQSFCFKHCSKDSGLWMNTNQYLISYHSWHKKSQQLKRTFRGISRVSTMILFHTSHEFSLACHSNFVYLISFKLSNKILVEYCCYRVHYEPCDINHWTVASSAKWSCGRPPSSLICVAAVADMKHCLTFSTTTLVTSRKATLFVAGCTVTSVRPKMVYFWPVLLSQIESWLPDSGVIHNHKVEYCKFLISGAGSYSKQQLRVIQLEFCNGVWCDN